MILVALLSHHVLVVVRIVCHNAIRGLSCAMPHSGLFRKFIDDFRSRSGLLPKTSPYLALSKLAWSSHHHSRALAVALIILQVGAVVGTLDFRPVFGAHIVSNCWLHLLAFLRVCFPLLLQVCLDSCVWVSTSSFSEFACRFIWLTLLQVLVGSARDLFQGTQID